jgi:hypothetical protein
MGNRLSSTCLEVSSKCSFGSWSIIELFAGSQMQVMYYFNYAPHPWRFGTGQFLQIPNCNLTFEGKCSYCSVIRP